MDQLNTETIRKAISTARDSGFRSIKLSAGTSSFQGVLSEEALTWGDEWEDDTQASGPVTKAINSPVVGYLKLIADKAKVGETISEGDQIGDIIALGIANEFLATCSGKVIAVHVNDGEPVEYGQTILEIEQK
ncbi:MAG: acetyl-CoA carboxylase biotin carboxyl carrier protein subunit [Fimbriimonadaceae bacterium]|nr:acetyl-CoA carboxylase biotin carboxyl carrier protein subunit [Fimbriimonadaceae bacterium]